MNAETQEAINGLRLILADAPRGSSDAERVQQAIARLEAEAAEVQRLRDQVIRAVQGQFAQICSYCGWESKRNGADWEDLQQHIKECPAHPLRAAEADAERLRAEVQRQQRHRKWLVKTARRNLDSWVFQAERGDTYAKMLIRAEAERDALREQVGEQHSIINLAREQLSLDQNVAALATLASGIRRPKYDPETFDECWPTGKEPELDHGEEGQAPVLRPGVEHDDMQSVVYQDDE